MAKEEQQQPKESRIKIKKKAWYKIISPNIFGMKEMGESYLTSAESAMGRTMDISLKELTGNVKDQNANVSFKVASVQNNRLMTEVIGYSLSTSFIRRIVKPNVNRVDNYFVLLSKDGKKVVIKTLMITLHKVKRSIRTNLGKQLQESLREELGKSDFNTFINNIVYHKVQQPLKKKLSKIYPLRELAVRTLFLAKENTGKAETPKAILPEQNAEIPAEVSEDSVEFAVEENTEAVAE